MYFLAIWYHATSATNGDFEKVLQCEVVWSTGSCMRCALVPPSQAGPRDGLVKCEEVHTSFRISFLKVMSWTATQVPTQEEARMNWLLSLFCDPHADDILRMEHLVQGAARICVSSSLPDSTMHRRTSTSRAYQIQCLGCSSSTHTCPRR